MKVRWLSLWMAVVLLAACGGEPAGPASPARPGAAAPGRALPVPGMPAPASPTAQEVARGRRVRAARVARRRRAELARLRRSLSVEGALRRALLTHRLTPREHGRLRADLRAARLAVRRLPGRRKLELGAVVRTVEGLAARRQLSSERLAPVFLVLRRNTAFWSRAPLPRPGTRTTFGRDPAVFQYYAGQGLQLHALASWGRANGLAAACLRSLRAKRPKHPCRRQLLARTLDRLTSLGVSRGGFLAWEYYFAYGGGQAPWASAIVQGTAVQALARGHRALGFERYARAADRALGAFETPPPVGIARRVRHGRHYLMYSFDADLRILNGTLQAVTGLRDAAALLHSARARRLHRSGERAVRAALGDYDTGAWSLYAAEGREATLGYHQLQEGFLGNLCARTRRRAYCETHARFARYEREPPRITIARPRGLRSRTRIALRFRLSKVSTVTARVRGPRGPVLSRVVTLPRGRHGWAWTPPVRGRYRLSVAARGLSGPIGTARRTIDVVRKDLATERRERAARRARERRARARARAKERRERAQRRARARARRHALTRRRERRARAREEDAGERPAQDG